MHYAEFKLNEPDLIPAMVSAFPFATIMVNGPTSPLAVHAPATLSTGADGSESLEFHIAVANPAFETMQTDPFVTVCFHGPSTAISPSWYEGRFPTRDADRSRTAPTYNYLNLVVTGRVTPLNTTELRDQIRDLVQKLEPGGGWQFHEIATETYAAWSALIRGFRVRIETADLTAKLSQEQNVEDRLGIAKGLRRRSGFMDDAMAGLVEGFDGSAGSLTSLICAR
ncbi:MULTISPECIES: FMN-binding negative transcriptional regulator [Hyphomicrobiales]|jgi:transcriptional regulator|uniref:FMN-binding negative transcriptional regulator n=1 Tax=Hyphomicrobiales TaxID=356 RepID=UPI000647A897|nr:MULTISPECIES: FMN-binding negative transcriptional regulator [Hyphomicrobiales]RKD74093.1 PaiB family negative transcriptional regulator [Rhizobium sp. WW_1]RZS83911.1 PaiB family negative transcriptional regulator [Phyllobacterium myrsinacearum]